MEDRGRAGQKVSLETLNTLDSYYNSAKREIALLLLLLLLLLSLFRLGTLHCGTPYCDAFSMRFVGVRRWILSLSYYLLLLLHPLYTRHTVPGHLTIARRPTINAYRFHAHRDKYGVARGTECRRAHPPPCPRYKYDPQSSENMW